MSHGVLSPNLSWCPTATDKHSPSTAGSKQWAAHRRQILRKVISKPFETLTGRWEIFAMWAPVGSLPQSNFCWEATDINIYPWNHLDLPGAKHKSNAMHKAIRSLWPKIWSYVLVATTTYIMDPHRNCYLSL